MNSQQKKNSKQTIYCKSHTATERRMLCHVNQNVCCGLYFAKLLLRMFLLLVYCVIFLKNLLVTAWTHSQLPSYICI